MPAKIQNQKIRWTDCFTKIEDHLEKIAQNSDISLKILTGSCVCLSVAQVVYFSKDLISLTS